MSENHYTLIPPPSQPLPRVDPAKILDQLKLITPESIQQAIDFCLKNIEGIRVRYDKEIAAEKAEIKKLRRVAKLIGAGVELDTDGRAAVGPVAPHRPRADADEPGGRPSDRIAEYLKKARVATVDNISKALGMSLPAVRMAVLRSGSRFEVDGTEISLGRTDHDKED